MFQKNDLSLTSTHNHMTQTIYFLNLGLIESPVIGIN